MDSSKKLNDLKDVFKKLPFDQDDINQNQLLLELLNITISLRDELKTSKQYILTIEDTRIALDALSAHLNGERFKSTLSEYQKLLADRLIDATILFKLK